MIRKIIIKLNEFLNKKLLFLTMLILASCHTEQREEQIKLPIKNSGVQNIKIQLEEKGFKWGAPAFVRIFKKESYLEVWLKDGAQYRLFREYPICIYSGELGPKLKEGDKQSPEGFYKINLNSLNPNSNFFLSFNLGYPNEYDRANGRTGNYLMVHGKCVSRGCYAMGDRQIAEIYTLVASALQHEQAYVNVHIFPFKMSDKTLQNYAQHRWFSFWQTLKPVYDYFEKNRLPPIVKVKNKRYSIENNKTNKK